MRYADSCCTYVEKHDNGQHVYAFTGPCIVTKKMVTVEVPAAGLFAYCQGAFIQNAFPNLSADDREFLMSGISAKGWALKFGGDEY